MLANNRTARLQRGLGIMRSMAAYMQPGRLKRMEPVYHAFVGEDDLVFDIGAHLGGRASMFTRLGAHVVAIEPQPHLQPWLRILIGRSSGVVILTQAVGAQSGTAELAVCRRTPMVSSMSADWRRSFDHSCINNRHTQWEDTVTVPVTTLDHLITQYGVPVFCSIDAQGYEAQALSGLTHAIPGLSMSFMPNAMEVAHACVDRLSCLGPYEFNVVYHDQQQFTLAHWKCMEAIRGWLDSGAGSAHAGQLFARIRR